MVIIYYYLATPMLGITSLILASSFTLLIFKYLNNNRNNKKTDSDPMKNSYLYFYNRNIEELLKANILEYNSYFQWKPCLLNVY